MDTLWIKLGGVVIIVVVFCEVYVIVGTVGNEEISLFVCTTCAV